MAIADETTLRIVLYEGEGAASLNAADRGATVTALLEQGYAVTCAGAGAVAPADDSAFDLRQITRAMTDLPHGHSAARSTRVRIVAAA